MIRGISVLASSVRPAPKRSRAVNHGAGVERLTAIASP